ncbi:MAG TPA: ABC transporter permease, partial [Solirubrobacterales bacterium]
WLLFPLALALLAVFTAAVSMMLSVLYVRFRDVAIIWAVLAQVLFYMTPILYPITILQDKTLERLLMVNPLTPIINEIQRWVIHNPEAQSAAAIAGGKVYLLPAAAIFLGVCVFAIWLFNRDAPRIAERL